MTETIKVYFDDSEVDINIRDIDVDNALSAAEDVNRAINILSNMLQDATSENDIKTVRKFFGDIMSIIIAGIIIPLEDIDR